MVKLKVSVELSVEVPNLTSTDGTAMSSSLRQLIEQNVKVYHRRGIFTLTPNVSYIGYEVSDEY